MVISRRRFLQTCTTAGGALLAAGPRAWAFEPVSIENPLGTYPHREWEKIYLDQYAYDRTFTWICAPNDTHMCRLKAFVRNGVMIRSEQNYDHDRCGDLYGNTATKAWNPRSCPKGYTMQRRVDGPYRLKGPVLRKGWKDWADAGFPSLSDNPELRTQYVRGVPPEEARGARDWNEYTWRGDQAPGHPFVHGLQTSDMDFNDMRFCKLVIQIGKNLIENKMPESHWLNECMARGAKLVDIAPEYNCPATKSDYWISVRPGLSDTAVILGVTKIMMDNKWYKPDFCRKFTDFPLLVRIDNLQRLRPQDVVADYQPKDISKGPSDKIQGLNNQQRRKIGDFCVWDSAQNKVVFLTRDDVGENMKVPAALEGSFQVELADGTDVEVMPIFEMYKRHLNDYDEQTVEEISGAPAQLVRRLAEDIWKTTEAGHPVAIHIGEGVNHYFHATLHNRATYLPLMLTGNIGKHGAGCHTWAGNYKGALFQASSWSGPGVGGYTHEDPFNPVLDETARITHDNLRHTTDVEDLSYWACGERSLTIQLPNGKTRNFTGDTHMPTPTKVVWYNNANFLNQAKWVYNIIVNVLPKAQHRWNTMTDPDENVISKVHPASREMLADDPLSLQGVEVPGDADVMMRMLVEDYARMGWDLKGIVTLARDPFYQAFHGLYLRLGEDSFRRQVAEILSRVGVARVKTVVAEPRPADRVEIELPASLSKGDDHA